MNYEDTIFGIFTYKQSKYYFLHLFNEYGPIEREQIESMYIKNYPDLVIDNLYSQGIGPFNNLSELQKYSFNLCQAVNGSEIVLLSVEKYNQATNEVINSEQFLNALKENGEVINNVDAKKHNIWNRIFT
jgi:hypothetical protein